MEPVATWTPRKVAAWLRGLDDSLQDYCFEDWELPGKYLLQLCPRSLEALTVWPLGHQEIILEGVEQLRALSSGLQSENLQSLTEGLLEGTQAFQSLVQGRLGGCVETPADVLGAAVQLVHEARSLLFWLNRYLFSHLNDFSSCQAIGELCGELGQALQEDCPAAEKESKVLRIPCGWDLLQHPELLPGGAAEAEGCTRASAAGRSFGPGNPHHQQLPALRVSSGHPGPHQPPAASPAWRRDCPGQRAGGGGLAPQKRGEGAAAGAGQGQLSAEEGPGAGDPTTDPSSAPGLTMPSEPITSSSLSVSQVTGSGPGWVLEGGPQLTLSLPHHSRTPSKDIFDFNLSSNPSPGPSPPAWTDSTFLGPKPLPSPPATAATYLAEVADTPERPEHPDRSPVPGCRKSKGVATRRRVSCRELGPPDCDGWLLLRKVPGGFMGPRWRRCWFVLKGHTLYWYRQPQDEKAEGLINVSNYSLESGQDQKKKYVFQLTHNVYKPFIFAADTLTDLSMWVRHLITCISKYQSPGRASLPREEDCYSETEAEDPDDEAGSCSASPSPAQATSSLHGDPSPAVTPQDSPRTSFSPATDSSEGALEGMVRGLRLGGVSLLGQQQPLTQEQWRSSFMRRNRDPQLNERVHRVRALQSTLKAKLQELQALEEVLGDPELTGEKFRRWKEQNQELYSEGLGAWGGEQAQGGSQVLNSDPKEQSSHPPPSDPEECSPLCPLTPESDPRPPDL
ncbi:connector enhancer of kinase suppressor of ras 1 isoform X2 [Bos taurus]|uniref:connector enhancer of kinase suppressor of ras 1 isoform X2 n=1 Tax=Bos taurus TaxID=9913 RepID=UPI000D536ECA|nr:connector enhancer of kinase suppressor of ras 1 isoform X2 [Bos taurus]